MRHFILIASAAILAAPVAAAPAPEMVVEGAPTAIVQFGDLNIDSRAGRRTLDRRLDAAIGQVCGDYAGALLELYQVNRIADCRTAANNSVRTQLADRATRLAAGQPVQHKLALRNH